MVNAGVNTAEATNFAISEWAPFAKKGGVCTCAYGGKERAVRDLFIKILLKLGRTKRYDPMAY